MAAVAESPALVPGVAIQTRVLDVDYAASQEQLERAIEEVEPDVVLAFGVDCDHDWISVERLAINLDCDDTPDNRGDRRYGVRIVEDGPVGYWATAPIEAICTKLMAAGSLRRRAAMPEATSATTSSIAACTWPPQAGSPMRWGFSTSRPFRSSCRAAGARSRG